MSKDQRKDKDSNYEEVVHPPHYGGGDDPHEAIKVIEAWGFGIPFCLGSALKYIKRAGSKPGQSVAKDLAKAAWYCERARMNAEREDKERAKKEFKDGANNRPVEAEIQKATQRK